MSLERSEVLSKYKSLVDENKELVKKVKSTVYKINRRLEHFGFVSQLSSISDCVEALTFVNTRSTSSSDALKELGIDCDCDCNLLGFSISDWKADIKTRKNEISNMLLIDKNKKAISTLKGFLSPDDLFELEMEKLDSLLSGNGSKDYKKAVDSSVLIDEDEDEEE